MPGRYDSSGNNVPLPEILPPTAGKREEISCFFEETPLQKIGEHEFRYQ
jgi:hypothetical protein